MAGEPIDDVAVRLTVDGADFLDQANRAIEETVNKLKSVPEAAVGMSDSLKSVAKDVILSSHDMSVSMESVANSIEGTAKAQGHSASEIINAAKQIRAEISGALADSYEKAFAKMEAATESLGRKLDPETRAKLKGLMDDLAVMSNSTDEAAARIEEFGNKVSASVSGRAQPSVSRFSAEIGGLVTKLVGGISLAYAFNKVKQFMQESIAVAEQYQKGLLELNAAVNASRQINGEAAGTMREWTTFAQDLSDQLGTPFVQTMLAVSASVQQMSRNLGLSKDQIQAMITLTAEWALENGKELGPSINMITRFINTGWSQSLANMGIVINDTVLAEAAQELQLNKSFDAMTQAEKEAVRYQAVMDQLGPAADQIAAALDTLTGRQNKANQTMNKAKLILGNLLLPAWVWLNEVLAKAALGLTTLIDLLGTGLIAAAAGAIGALAGAAFGLTEFWNQLVSGSFDGQKVWNAFADNFVNTTRSVFEEGIKNMVGGLDQFKDSAAGAGEAGAAMAAAVAEAVTAATPVIDQAMQEWTDGIDNASQTLADRQEDISTHLSDKLADLQTKLSRDLTDIDRTSAEKRLATINKYNNQEIRVREDHQRRLKELERKYLFDLEDAVRERDARKVLNLQRGYNLARQKEEEDYSIAEKRRKQDFQNQLADIERQRRLRREQRIAEYKQQVEDARLAAERQRQDTETAYRRELRDLQAQINRRLAAQANAIQAQVSLNGAGLDALYKQLLDAYGPNGWVESFYHRYAQIIASAGGYTAATPGHNYGSINTAGGRQRGGTLTAMSPTMVPVGEGRPEQLTVTPLSAGDGRPSAGFRGGAGAGAEKLQLQVNVMADDKLMVEVTDHVSNEVADVIAKVSRTNSRQGGITGR